LIVLFCNRQQAHLLQGLVGIEDLEVPADNLDGADDDPQMRLRYGRPDNRLEVWTQRFEEGRELQVLSPRPHHRQTNEAEISIDVVRVGARQRNTLRFRLQEGADQLIVNGLDRCGCGKGCPEMIEALDRLVDRAAVGVGGVGDQAIPRGERAQRTRRGTADRDDIERAPLVRAGVPELLRPQNGRQHAPGECGVRPATL
jgi:hypothetical protein